MLQEAQNLQTVAQTPWLLWLGLCHRGSVDVQFLGDGLRDVPIPT